MHAQRLRIGACVYSVADEVRLVCARHSLCIVEEARRAFGAVAGFDGAATVVDDDGLGRDALRVVHGEQGGATLDGGLLRERVEGKARMDDEMRRRQQRACDSFFRGRTQWMTVVDAGCFEPKKGSNDISVNS